MIDPSDSVQKLLFAFTFKSKYTLKMNFGSKQWKSKYAVEMEIDFKRQMPHTEPLTVSIHDDLFHRLFFVLSEGKHPDFHYISSISKNIQWQIHCSVFTLSYFFQRSENVIELLTRFFLLSVYPYKFRISNSTKKQRKRTKK